MVKIVILFFCLLSLSSVAMENDLNHYSRLLDNLARMQDLGRSFNNFGLNSPYTRNNSTANHSKFIDIPQELKSKSFFHIKCDCNDLVIEDHYCGSHALTHAVDIEQTYDVRPCILAPSNEVKQAFIKLGIGNTKVDKMKIINIKKIAEYIKLDYVFLEFNKDVIESVFSCHQELPCIAALKKLEQMRFEIINAGSKPAIKHLFAVFEVKNSSGVIENHVVLFSVVWDGEQISLIAHDNLNEPMKIDTPLFKFSQFFIKFFIEIDREKIIYEKLINTLSDSRHSQKYLAKFFSYSQTSQRNDFLEFLFTQWLENAKSSCFSESILTIKPLNSPIALLKNLHSIQEQSIAKDLVIKIYSAMLNIIYSHTDKDVNRKINTLDNIIKAIKKSSLEQKIFSLQNNEEANLLFESAQNLRTSLNKY